MKKLVQLFLLISQNNGIHKARTPPQEGGAKSNRALWGGCRDDCRFAKMRDFSNGILKNYNPLRCHVYHRGSIRVLQKHYCQLTRAIRLARITEDTGSSGMRRRTCTRLMVRLQSLRVFIYTTYSRNTYQLAHATQYIDLRTLPDTGSSAHKTKKLRKMYHDA